jgi:hypothetical protein
MALNIENFPIDGSERNRRLNLLVNAARKLDNLAGDNLIKITSTEHGKTIKLDFNKLMERVPKFGVGGGIRKAYVKDTPAAVETVDCYLDTDATGTEVTVNCSVIGGTALNSALSRLADGELIFVAYVGGEWWCLGAPFQTICNA